MRALNSAYLLVLPFALIIFLKARNSQLAKKNVTVKILSLLLAFSCINGSGYSQWNSQTSGITSYLTSLYFFNQSTGWAAGDQGKILKTTNGGTNWTLQTSGVSHNFNRIQFVDANSGWTSGGSFSIMRTTNGGVNWVEHNTGSTVGLYIFFADVSSGWGVGANGTIYKTTNSGVNWSQQISGVTNYLTSIYFTNNNTGWAGGFEGKILYTTNGGTNWSQQTSGTGTEFFSIFFANSLTGWAVGGAGNMRRTTNGGSNWTAMISPTGEDLLSVFFTGSSTGWVAGSNGKMIATTNGGANWSQQTVPVNASLNSVYFIGTSGWSCGTNGTIISTVTGGYAVGLPVLNSPANNTSGISLTPQLRWNRVSGATSYRVQLSTDSNFTITLVNDSTVTDSLYTVLSGVLQNNVKYYWRVRAKNAVGSGLYSSVWNFTTSLTGISHAGNEIPDEHKLYNNYPNPFNPSTRIKFDLPKHSFVKLTVFDITGRETGVLVNENLNAGSYEYEFNAVNLSSGVYFYRISAGDFTNIKKMILVK
jgi:photosystem II stability/assembly factor-like uncharacterized protein